MKTDITPIHRKSGTISAMETEGTHSPLPEPELLQGDLAAGEGRWHDAIDQWELAGQLTPELEPAIEARLGWYLSHRPGARAGRQSFRSTMHLMLLCLATALMASVLVLLPDTPGSTSSNLVAIGAWIIIAVSVVAAIVASRRLGDARADPASDVATQLRHAKSQALYQVQTMTEGEARNDR